MNELEARTLVYRPPPAVFEVLADVPGYARYSPYLRSVSTDGDGGSGTEYGFRFGWRGVGYTVRTRVTEFVPPHRIGFTVTEGRSASGAWVIEQPPDRPSDGQPASLVRFCVRYEPDPTAVGRVRLPRFLSLDRVIDSVAPLAEREAERVVERAVEDLEGTRRAVDLDVHLRSDVSPVSG